MNTSDRTKTFWANPCLPWMTWKPTRFGHVWEPINGFRLETDYKLPTRSDQILLYYMLMISQKHDWATCLTFSKYELLKNTGIKIGKRSYLRLDDALERWFRIRVYYNNSFVCADKKGVTKVSGAFRILDSYEFIEHKQSGRTNKSEICL